MKIPLGDRYLLHEAATRKRRRQPRLPRLRAILRSDLYDWPRRLSRRAARLFRGETHRGRKRSFMTLAVHLEEHVPVDVNYDTLVVEKRRAAHLSGRLRSWNEPDLTVAH